MNNWKEIGDAPLDGSKILVTFYPVSKGEVPYNIVHWGSGNSNSPGWLIRSTRKLRYEPTHWMPLPNPPETE